ncbi:MAG: flagellar filament capping protein FliD [Gammaproteobacteria bacterium]|nr:flagellar filament capping protein FliD [Gammaproteobacteria bacterium]
MSHITISGIGSGFDSANLVDQLINAEREPATKRLDSREIELQAQLSSFGSLKGALSAFQDTAKSLQSSTIFQGRQATSGNSDAYTVRASSIASVGSYSIDVNQLAQSNKLASASFSAVDSEVGYGTLSFEFGTYTFDGSDIENGFTANADKTTKSVEISAGKNTLSDIRDAVNAAEIGVRASLVNDGEGFRLVFASADSGDNSALRITASDSSDASNSDNQGLSQLVFSETTRNMSRTAKGLDASITIDGLAITSATNKLSEAISGVTLDLRQVTTETSTINVALDTASASSAVSDLVSNYNALVSTISASSGFNFETKEGAVLLGDATVRGVSLQISAVFGNFVSGAPGDFKTLSDIGISVQRNGTLSLNSEKFDAAMDANLGDVGRLFTAPKGDNNLGFADQLESVIGRLLSDNGIVGARTEGINDRISDINTQRRDLDERLSSMESRLRKQFIGLDTLLSRLNSTSDFLTQQLANLPSLNPK